jgi:DNA polymerase I-like protein with 3'-5' exonuclease and polymerase domains
MFFDDFELIPRKRARLKVPPPIPETGWRPPSSFPNLSTALAIAFDTETREDDFAHGPGWARGKGRIVGFSVAALGHAGERWRGYFPLRHEVEAHNNLDPETCLSWARHVLESTPHIPKIGANLLYDVGWLTEENVFVAGPLLDVQFAEALIDESGDTNLDWLGEKYLGVGKHASLLYEWCARAYGGNATGIQRSNIFRAPPSLVGPYAEADAEMCFDIFSRQRAILEREGTLSLFDMECSLIRLLVRMRRQGVQVDLDRAAELHYRLKLDIEAKEKALHDEHGLRVNVDSNDDVSKLFDVAGVPYPRTLPSSRHPNGQPSFQKDWLKAQEHPVGKAVNYIRELKKVRSTFLRSYILESNVRGRLHCQFHPLRSDDGGAKTGRFSSSDPNLQNIPVRTKEGKEVRTIFVPFHGHAKFNKKDYSQIEYRMLAHFAVGPGSEELRAKYNNDPKTDYHDVVQTNVKNITGILIERRPIKNLNFGLLYGQGEGLLAQKNNFEKRQATEVFKAYHLGAPYAKPTMAAIAQEVQIYGYVTTILGRRTRFEMWEPIETNYNEGRQPALPYELAVRRYGPRIKRAFDYRGVNYKLQGSAADVIKKAMVALDQSGVFDVTGVPLLQVHDELDWSIPDESPIVAEAHRFIEYTLETAVTAKVPIKVDSKYGPNWGAID